jgi:hypothetical protein
MLGWGPTLVSVSIRRLNAREQLQLGLRGRALPRCTVSLAVHSPRDPRTGCSGYAVMPGYPKFCVSMQTTFVCVINTVGGYECPRYADGSPPLKNKKATADKRGVLKLDVSLRGTHATLPLARQRRYPHIDGFIEPWTRAGKLRQGLTFDRPPPKAAARALQPAPPLQLPHTRPAREHARTAHARTACADRDRGSRRARGRDPRPRLRVRTATARRARRWADRRRPTDRRLVTPRPRPLRSRIRTTRRRRTDPRRVPTWFLLFGSDDRRELDELEIQRADGTWLRGECPTLCVGMTKK